MSTIAVELRIEGRVQGVWFRGWTREQAERLGLAGWVANNPDGTVRALFVGPGVAVEEMVAACREGPRDAAVSAVERRDLAEVPAVEGFRVHR